MIAVIQRVERAEVRVGDRLVSRIGPGALVLLGVRTSDDAQEAQYLATRVTSLRIFNDDQGKMNLSVQDVGGSILVVSQFTLHADTRKGHRPSYIDAAPPAHAERMYTSFIEACRAILGEDRVGTGEFRAMMKVELVNDGPVTVTVQSKNEYRSS